MNKHWAQKNNTQEVYKWWLGIATTCSLCIGRNDAIHYKKGLLYKVSARMSSSITGQVTITDFEGHCQYMWYEGLISSHKYRERFKS